MVGGTPPGSLADVLATMQARHVRRLPVVGPQQNLLGVVPADDLPQWRAADLKSLVRAIGEQVKVEAIARP
jgi:CBS domain-containing protein